MIGTTLGHYKILDLLGAGGMGEVYRAEDTTLDREVALKVLPADLAGSQERLERFQREAHTLAALDHPNIVHIYSVESDANTPWAEESSTELPRFDAPDKVYWWPYSWSPDGNVLAGNLVGRRADGSYAKGVVLFSFDTGEYRRVTDFGWIPLWLADGRRILFASQSWPTTYSILDTATGESREIFSAESLEIAPDSFEWVALSSSNRTLVFDRYHQESDIWMLTLEEQD